MSSPSPSPSAAPSAAPSVAPSVGPSVAPSVAPSAAPSVAPSAAPSAVPSAAPSVAPSAAPSVQPSSSPSPGPQTDLRVIIPGINGKIQMNAILNELMRKGYQLDNIEKKVFTYVDEIDKYSMILKGNLSNINKDELKKNITNKLNENLKTSLNLKNLRDRINATIYEIKQISNNEIIIKFYIPIKILNYSN